MYPTEVTCALQAEKTDTLQSLTGRRASVCSKRLETGEGRARVGSFRPKVRCNGGGSRQGQQARLRPPTATRGSTRSATEQAGGELQPRPQCPPRRPPPSAHAAWPGRPLTAPPGPGALAIVGRNWPERRGLGSVRCAGLANSPEHVSSRLSSGGDRTDLQYGEGRLGGRRKDHLRETARADASIESGVVLSSFFLNG